MKPEFSKNSPEEKIGEYFNLESFISHFKDISNLILIGMLIFNIYSIKKYCIFGIICKNF